METQLDESGIKATINSYLLSALEEDAQKRTDRPTDSVEFEFGADLMEGLIHEHQQALKEQDYEIIQAEVDQLLREQGIRLTPENYAAFSREMLEAMVALLEIMLHRDRGDFEFEEKVLRKRDVSPEISEAASPDRINLTDLADMYLHAQTASNNWSDNALHENSRYCQTLIEIVGDIDINDISTEVLENYVTILRKLPANRHRSSRFRDKPISELIAMKDVGTMAPSTVNKNIRSIARFFDWATQAGHISPNQKPGELIDRIR